MTGPIGRREALRATAAAVMSVAARGALASGASERSSSVEELAPSPMEIVNVGDLSVLFGNSTGHGSGRTGYCGIWALTGAHDPHNAFISSYAGFIYNSHRGRPVQLRRLKEDQVEFRIADASTDTRALFTVRPPHYVDCEATLLLHNPYNAPYLLQSWASYINSPEDGDIHFRHQGKWIRAHSPKHGVEATYAPESLRDIEDDLRHLTPDERKNNFVYGYSPQRFSEPFYYGRIRSMALAYMFDRPDEIRFTISPSGGGWSILPGKGCPAWDWLWLIPKIEAKKPYTLRIRMVYKPFVSPEDILEEYNKWPQKRA